MEKNSKVKASGNQIVAGIDVGGSRKGFHAVALDNDAYHSQFQTTDPILMARWCCDIQAEVIGIDAPCRWSTDGRARPAERQLMGQGIQCFASPTRERAVNHPGNYYGWMLNGEALFRTLASSHPLCTALPLAQGQTCCCFETFPHAISCALTGSLVAAQHKRTIRRALLAQAGLFTAACSNIDWIDATLCALAAHHLAAKQPCTAYGDATTGLIIVPACSAQSTQSKCNISE
jgi:hypothetical protein